eukprot:1379037-Amorphochlora_amoeboformis.AAC.1
MLLTTPHHLGNTMLPICFLTTRYQLDNTTLAICFLSTGHQLGRELEREYLLRGFTAQQLHQQTHANSQQTRQLFNYRTTHLDTSHSYDTHSHFGNQHSTIGY